MIEDYKPGHDLQETTSYAHELGHAFSCGHTDRTKMMMSGDGSDGFQMTRSDINTINPTEP
jgi:predicted Zn-dependent protease